MMAAPPAHTSPPPARPSSDEPAPARVVACPLCGESLTRTLATELRYGQGCVRLCENCELGVLAADPTDQPGYADGAYRERHGPRPDQPTSHEELFDFMVDFQEERLRRLRPFLGAGTRLLEVGCASGYFLAHVAAYVGEAVGIDLDAGAATCAARRSGCRVLTGTPDASDLAPGSFDVVCAFQTLEHVADPLGFLAQLRRLTRPDGVVVVEVPNLHDPLLAVYDVPAWRRFYFHLAHRWYFSAAALRRAAHLAGLRGQTEFVQDYNFLNHLHWHYTATPQDSCRPGLMPVHWPTRAAAPVELRRALDGWAQRADREYRAVLARFGVTDNLWFVGSPACDAAHAPPALDPARPARPLALAPQGGQP